MRVVLGVEYDGSYFCGWQSQINACGVQDKLEQAIALIAKHKICLHAAGRTDTGVHATMQVVHFETSATRPESAWVRGVNAFLPHSIKAVWSKVVDENFHARFSAMQRHYQYLLVNAPVAPAIKAKHAGWYHLRLDVAAMQTAASYLLGEHDFSAFRASECQAKSAIRTITKANVYADGPHILFNFSANAFLQHQVRNMVGALIYVGNGKHAPERIKSLLNGKDRTQSPPTFSAAGLYLTGVDYDPKWQLPLTHRQIFTT